MKSTLRESALKGCLLSILLGMVLLLKRLIHNFSRCHVSHPCDVEGEGNEVSLVAKTNNQLGDGSMYVCISSVPILWRRRPYLIEYVHIE